MANDLSFDAGLTASFANAGMSAGSTSTYTTTTTTAGVINGLWVTTLASSSNTATPTTDASTGAAFLALQPNQCCAMVFGQNKAGAIKMCQGEIIPTLVGVTTTVGGLLNAPQFPGLPNDFMVLAYCVVQTAPSAAAWTPGTSSWTASGVSTSTFVNCAQLPLRPQTS